jgi:chromosome partitioning protein
MKNKSAKQTIALINHYKTNAKIRMDNIKKDRAKQTKKLNDHGVNQKLDFRTYTKTEAMEWLNIEYLTTFNRAFNSICEKYPERLFERESNRTYRFTLEDLHFFASEMGVPQFERAQECDVNVIVVSSLKGGVGKSTSCVNIATGLAVSNNKRYRVGVIDFDPQGTATLFGVTNLSDEDYSVGDITQDNYDLDGMTEKEFVMNCFLETKIPNLKYLPGRLSDFFFETFVEKKFENATAEERLASNRILKEKIIDQVKDEFDFIIIDTPPALNKALYNALYAANAMIIPVEPEIVAEDATEKFFERFSSVYNVLDHAGHEGYDFIKILATNYDAAGQNKSSALHRYHFDGMKRAYRDGVISTPMKHSKAYPICADFFTSIYGLKPSEYPKTKKHIIDAVDNMNEIVEDIEYLCTDIWDAQKENYNG